MIEESSNDPEFNVIRLSEDYALASKGFDCEDQDLNEFLLVDSLPNQKQLLTVTYIIEDREGCLIGFFSVLNDKLTSEDIGEVRNRVQRRIPNRKRYNTYPCVKIARLGIHKDYKNRKFGRAIIDYIKLLFLTENRTGCRFVTVDAYSTSAGFYEKNGFSFLTSKDAGEKTRQMYFDLMVVLNQLLSK